MMKTEPVAPFIMVKSQLTLHLLIVTLDPPADLPQPHEVLKRSLLGSC
jgi:hypothetical protein